MIQIDEGLCIRSEDIRYVCSESHLIECRIYTNTGEFFRSPTLVSKVFDLINQAERSNNNAIES